MHLTCPVKCREVTVKKKRVETFRNIRYLVHVSYVRPYIQTARPITQYGSTGMAMGCSAL